MRFIDYVKRHKTMLRSHPMFKIYLGGGMAVKLIAGKPGTKDFDFTFAVPRPLKPQEVPKYSLAMYTFMYNFLKGFTRMDALNIKSYARKSFLPATGKRTYHVIQFGKDFVDCTLAYVPGTRRVLLKKYGLAISNHLYRDVLAVLAGSFVYKKVMPRNPLIGEHPEKGLKNLERVKVLRKLRSPKSVKTLRFMSAIEKRHLATATRRARSALVRIGTRARTSV
jgi:hypothetical protein